MPRPLGPCVLRPVPPGPPRSSLSRLCAPPLAHPQRLKCPHLTGLRGSGVSPRDTVPQSPPAPDASRLHTPKDTRHPGLSRAWHPSPTALPLLGGNRPSTFLQGPQILPDPRHLTSGMGKGFSLSQPLAAPSLSKPHSLDTARGRGI